MKRLMSAVLILAVYLVAPVVPGVASESVTDLREVKIQCPVCGKEQAGVATVDGELVQRVAGSLVLALGEAEKHPDWEISAYLVKQGQAGVDSLGLPEVSELARILSFNLSQGPMCQASKDVEELEILLLATGKYCGGKQCQWTKRLESQHPDWGRPMCVTVGLHQIRKGMTTTQAAKSLNMAPVVSTSYTKYPTVSTVEWQYTGRPWQHLVFRLDLLESWHPAHEEKRGW